MCENDFAKDYLKNYSVDSDMLLIVGQSFVKLGLMSADKYYSYLLKILNKYSNIQDYYYCPHRNEDVKDVYGFCNKLGLKIVKTNLPIEMEILRMGILPKYIIGFNYAALLNLRKIFPKQIDVCAIRLYESDNYTSGTGAIYDKIYEEFQNNKIIIIS